MKKIEQQEAINHFALMTNNPNPTVEYIRQVVPSSADEPYPIFGTGAGKLFYCNVYGRNLSFLKNNDNVKVGSGLTLIPEFDGTLNEQRLTFETLDAFYDSAAGEVVIEGYSCNK